MSDHAIVLACNPGYGFGMISTMNAMAHYGTDADFEVAYEEFGQDYREKVSSAFSFGVNWTSQSELYGEIKDRRLDQTNGVHLQWLSGWVLAHRLLNEKKYKSICIIQADEFMFVNLNKYFSMADSGKLVCSEVNGYKVSEFNFGDIRNNRIGWFGLFDGLVFIGQQDYILPRMFLDFHETIDHYCSLKDDPPDLDRVEAQPLIKEMITRALNKQIVPLNGTQWCGDAEYNISRYYIKGDEFFREFKGETMQLKGWHRRWWLPGEMIRYVGIGGPTGQAIEVNANLAKSFMERFNNMRPEIASDIYAKGYFKTPEATNE